MRLDTTPRPVMGTGRGSTRTASAPRLAAVALLALAWLLPVSGGGLVPARAVAEEPAKKKEPAPKVDAASVYFGRAKRFRVPAEIDAESVYAEIPEYRRIQDEGLGPDDVEYQVLLSKTSRRFQRAVRKAAKGGGYDLVAELGSVENVKDVPDISQDVIDAL